MSDSELEPLYRTFTVEPHHDGWRLDRFLAARLARLSRTHATRICNADGIVWISPPRAAIKPATRVHTGDCVHLRRPGSQEPIPRHLLPNVLYFDERVALINKPSGLLTHPTAKIYNCSLTRILQLGLIPNLPTTAEPVHRLDRDTSGVMMLGLTKPTIAYLRSAFHRDPTLRKTYHAVVSDPQHLWKPNQHTFLRDPLGFDPSSPIRVKMGRGTLSASTEVLCLQRTKTHALLACTLHSGRQHQIRAHLSLFGTPIFGDTLYSMTDAFFLEWINHEDPRNDPHLCAQLPWPRLCLHAYSLSWTHPHTDQTHTTHAPIPRDFPDLTELGHLF